MQIEVTFPGGMGVDARVGRYTVSTDQSPAEGGSGQAPSPFDLFLASIGTCAGYYVLAFMKQRSLPTEGLSIVQRLVKNGESGMIDQIELDILLPEGFPERYRTAVARAAEHCKVKKHLENPPAIAVRTRVGQEQAPV